MGAQAGRKGFVSEINVTPFVDVMLVLLIIFMVTAPMMQEGLDVDLPTTTNAEILPTDVEHMVLTIKQDASLFLDGYAVTMEELPGHLRRLVSEKGRQLYIQGDTALAYGVVVEVMGIAREAGIEKIGMVAERQQEKETR